MRLRLAAWALLISLGVWHCDFAGPRTPDNLLSIKLDDSLARFDTLRIDILYSDGSPYKEAVFYDKYAPAQDHTLRDLDLGAHPPAVYQILVTGIRAGKPALVYAVAMDSEGSQPPKILVRETPPDTSRPAADTLPTRIELLTPSPLLLTTLSMASPIRARVLPASADQAILYSVADSSIVRLDAGGLIRPGRAGETDVILRAKGDPEVAAVLRVKIGEAVEVKGVSLAPGRLSLYTGGAALKLTASVSPPEARVGVLFQSNDESVARVDSQGTVTPGIPGQADIRAFPSGHPSLALVCKVTVESDPPVLDAGSNREVRAGDTLTFPLTVTQKYGGVAALKWDLDGDDAWDDSVRLAAAVPAPRHVYQAKDTAVTVRFYARDTEGNIVIVARRVHIHPVLAAPHFTDATSPTPTFQARPTWAWTGNPGGSGIFRYALDEGPEKETRAMVFQSDTLKEGLHAFSVRELDAYCALSEAAVRVIEVALGPVVTITSPAGGLLTNAASVAVTWSLKPGQGAIVNNSNTEKLGGKQGAITIIRRETDAFGNQAADTVIIFRDTVAPSAPAFTSESSPAAVNAGNGTLLQWAWARDSADHFLVSLNGANTIKLTVPVFQLANPLDQTYILAVTAVDSAGNLSAPTSYSIFVDRKAPPTPVVSGNTVLGAPSWTWSAAAGSDGSRLFRYRFATPTATIADYSAETAATSYSPSGLAPGLYNLQVQERDLAGNWSVAGSFQLQVQ
ncbi:MAG: Ig-like domain-containing protein [Fibrobacteria bacterium]